MRQEYKYLIKNSELHTLRKLIYPYTIKDDHFAIKNIKDYTVRSVYFDTKNLDEYHKKLSGDYSREKLRIRGYIPIISEDMLFLEIKSKINMGQKKYRAPILLSKIDDFFNGSDISKCVLKRSDFPDALINASHFMYYIKRYNMVPIVQVIYEREAYINKFDHNVRVTFDKNLRCIPFPKLNKFYQDQSIKYIFRNHSILEVKSDTGFPKWMTPIVNHFGIKREALSKYTMSIDRALNLNNGYLQNQIIRKSYIFK